MKYSNVVIIDYTNWKGVRRMRQILPMRLLFAKNAYHPDEQWLLEAIDIEDYDTLPIVKTFAMKDIHSWSVVPADETKLQLVDRWPFKKET